MDDQRTRHGLCSRGATRRTFLRTAAGGVALLLARVSQPRSPALGLETHEDETSVACDRLDGWALFNPGGRPPEGKLSITRIPGTFREGAGAVEYRYTRTPGHVDLLGTSVLLTSLRTIELDVWSQVATTLIVGFEDRDGATFHATIDLAAGKWQRASVGVRDFRLNDDSQVKKPGVDPRRLGLGVALADLGPVIGARGPNVLRISFMKITRDPLRVVQMPPALDRQTLKIAESGYGRGHAVVRNGGALNIAAPRFGLSGNVAVDAGAFVVQGCALSLHGRYAHELGIAGTHGAVIRFADAVVSAQFPSGISLADRSTLEIARTEFGEAGLTVDVQNGCAVALRGAKNPGEFILSPGSRIDVDDCEAVLLWLASGPGRLAAVAVPDGQMVHAWSSPAGSAAQITLRRSRGILWGLISQRGSDVVVERSKLVAVGVHFSGSAKEVISGIKNRQPTSNFTLSVSDRKLKVLRSEVGAWNFYAAEHSEITLQDSTFGEGFASQSARLTVQRCTCDGSGGYVRAEGRGIMEVDRSRLVPDVVATDEATLLLRDCIVEGSIRASGRANVRLVNTKVAGAVERYDGAVVERR